MNNKIALGTTALSALMLLAPIGTASDATAQSTSMFLVRAGEIVECLNPDFSSLDGGLGFGHSINSLNADEVGCESTMAAPAAPSTRSCDITNLVCASAFAWASKPFCRNTATQQIYPCWSGGGSGSATGDLGLVTGTLTGSTNGIALADSCYAPSPLQITCYVSASNTEYPGTTVYVTVSVTAAAAYGTATTPPALASA